jgi:hypothetical protein
MEVFQKNMFGFEIYILKKTRTIFMTGILIHVKIGSQFLIWFSHVTMSISSHHENPVEN